MLGGGVGMWWRELRFLSVVDVVDVVDVMMMVEGCWEGAEKKNDIFCYEISYQY